MRPARIPVLLLWLTCTLAQAAQAPVQPADAVPPQREARTVMCERGELLFHDDFDATTPAGAWNGFSSGEWTSGNGVLRVTYTGGHSLYHEQRMALKDVVIQMSFRFDEGVNTVTMGMEGGPTGHVMRMNFHRTAVDISRMPGVGKDAHDRVADGRVKFESGKWYTMVMELCGTEALMTIDDATLLYGTADGLDCDKHSFILGADASGGKYASFARCSVWRATAKRDWTQKRATVQRLVKHGEPTPDAVGQLMQDDPARLAPAFPSPSAVPKVARLEEQIAAGSVGAGSKALEKLGADKDAATVAAAAASLQVVAAWKVAMDAELQRLSAAGDAYAAAELAGTMARFYAGDLGKAYRDQAAEAKKDPAYAAGKECQRLAAMPYEARRDPAFAKAVDAFARKYPGFYVPLAQRLIAK